MSTVAVTVRRVEPRTDSYANSSSDPRPDSLHRDMENARKLAKLLDSQFSIGGFNFGLDGIVGLIPGIGDVVTNGMGFYLLFIAHKHRLGAGVLGAMFFNLALDWLVGLVPILGDLFDIVFKANIRNLAILEKAVAARQGKR